MMTRRVCDILNDRVVTAESESRVADVLREVENRRATHVAVFDAGRFSGLVRLQDILMSSADRIFADLMREPSTVTLRSETPVQEALEAMRDSAADALPVVDNAGGFAGLITQESLVDAVVAEERELRQESERLRAAIAEERAKLQAVLDTAAEGIITIDRQGMIESFNMAAESIFGYAAGEVIGKKVDTLMPSPAREEHDEYLACCLRKGEGKPGATRREVVGRRKDGTTFPMELNTSVVHFGDRMLFTEIVHDITERKHAEEALRLSEERFRSAIVEAPFPIIIHAEGGEIIQINKIWTELTGWGPEDIPTVSEWTELAYGQRKESARSRIDKVFERDTRVEEGAYFITTRHGDKLIWDFSTSPLGRLPDGRRLAISIAKDITERERVEEQLRKLSTAVEQSPATVVITDTEGTIEYVNPRFTETTGYTAEEAIGQNPRILKSGDMSPDAYKQMWETVLAGKVWRGEFHNRKKNGEFYWEAASISPIRNSEGAITHFLAVKEDITERKQAEAELQDGNTMLVAALESEKHIAIALEAEREKAEAANLAKSEFLANMSHEIRTPMTAMLGFIDEIADGCPQQCTYGSSQLRNHLATIARNADLLLRIINDILDLSKIEAGKMTVRRTNCKPCEIVAEVNSLMRIQATAKGLALDIEYVGSMPETIQTDPIRLRQILINLLSNAIKFTDTGGVRLITRFVRHAEGDRDENPKVLCMQFDVVDTGRGMTEADVAGLFQPFMQADTSTTRVFGGTGLGLVISKRFAGMLGGNVTVVETQEGVGTRFRATIATGPLDGVKMLDNPMSATVVARDSGATAPSSDRSGLHGCRILLAEDGPDNQRLISMILTKVGADVTVENNGKLALDAALAARDDGNPFDVILMDMQMPVMGGYEATRQLRKKGYTGPIIALTAHTMEGDREKCLKAGCDEYVPKPINRMKLIEIIQILVEPAALPASS